MKKIIMLFMALCMVLPALNAQNNKALNKALKKEYKVKMKEFKKGGWMLYGSSRSLDVALLNHYGKLNKEGEDAYEIVGTCSKFKSKNVGHQTCINNACNIYAQQAGRQLKGRIVSDIAGNGDDVSGEFDHFYAAYESLVQKGTQRRVAGVFFRYPQQQGWKLRDADILCSKRKCCHPSKNPCIRECCKRKCSRPKICKEGKRLRSRRIQTNNRFYIHQ